MLTDGTFAVRGHYSTGAAVMQEGCLFCQCFLLETLRRFRHNLRADHFSINKHSPHLGHDLKGAAVGDDHIRIFAHFQ